MNEHKIFYIRAARCRRCGGILTSRRAVELGYGCVCARKAGIQAAAPPPEQITFDDLKITEKDVGYDDP